MIANGQKSLSPQANEVDNLHAYLGDNSLQQLIQALELFIYCFGEWLQSQNIIIPTYWNLCNIWNIC